MRRWLCLVMVAVVAVLGLAALGGLLGACRRPSEWQVVESPDPEAEQQAIETARQVALEEGVDLDIYDRVEAFLFSNGVWHVRFHVKDSWWPYSSPGLGGHFSVAIYPDGQTRLIPGR